MIEELDILFSPLFPEKKRKKGSSAMNKILWMIILVGTGAVGLLLAPIFLPSLGDEPIKAKSGQERVALERIGKYCFGTAGVGNDTATCDLWFARYREVMNGEVVATNNIEDPWSVYKKGGSN